MRRRDFLKTTSAGLLAGMLPNLDVFDGYAPGFTAIRRNVGTYEADGGTIGWLIADDAFVVVDTQQPPTDAQALEGMRERSARRIDYVINTHHHGDHTDGNPVFAPFADHIVAQRNVPKWQNIRAEERELAENVVADILYDTALSLDVGDETVNLSYHGPAHTSGDTVVYFEKADVVHMGDLIFNRYPAYIDRRAGARISGWMKVLETAHARFTDETAFIFGHGKTIRGDRSDLLYMRDFLGGLLSFTEAGIKAGKSKDEIAETKRLPDFPDSYTEEWETGIPNCLRVAYDELTEG
jgi:glyoxylase-like metal-dependent hydrolase (beta-lactamase superfamily II)